MSDPVTTDAVIRPARPGDEAGAYHVCLKTGDHGEDGEPFYREDPDALGRIFVGPYLAFEPELSLILEDEHGDLRLRARRARLATRSTSATNASGGRACARSFPRRRGIPPAGRRVQQVHTCYHHPDYFCPEPYEAYPSHLHIDLLPRAQGRGLRPPHDGAGHGDASRGADRPARISA